MPNGTLARFVHHLAGEETVDAMPSASDLSSQLFRFVRCPVRG
jgi:hypothetical protein